MTEGRCRCYLIDPSLNTRVKFVDLVVLFYVLCYQMSVVYRVLILEILFLLFSPLRILTWSN